MLTTKFDKFDEHTPGGAGMQERDLTLDPATWRAIDELDSVGREAVKRAGEIAHLETDVMHRGATTFGHEARDTRLAIGRLQELDTRIALRRERGADALIREIMHRTHVVAEQVAVERDRVLQRWHSDADVMELSGCDGQARGS